MRSPRIGPAWTRLLALTFATFVSLSAVSGAAAQVTREESPLTPAQEASIREEMAALAGVLMQGGKSPQEAKLAVNAVGICFGAAYSHGLTREQASVICGEVLDAYTIQPGTILYQLTPDDKQWIASRTTIWTSELSALLEPDQLAAVQTTMQTCLEGYMRRGEDRDGAVRRCALGVMPILNKPEFRELIINSALNGR